MVTGPAFGGDGAAFFGVAAFFHGGTLDSAGDAGASTEGEATAAALGATDLVHGGGLIGQTCFFTATTGATVRVVRIVSEITLRASPRLVLASRFGLTLTIVGKPLAASRFASFLLRCGHGG